MFFSGCSKHKSQKQISFGGILPYSLTGGLLLNGKSRSVTVNQKSRSAVTVNIFFPLGVLPNAFFLTSKNERHSEYFSISRIQE